MYIGFCKDSSSYVTSKPWDYLILGEPCKALVAPLQQVAAFVQLREGGCKATARESKLGSAVAGNNLGCMLLASV